MQDYIDLRDQKFSYFGIGSEISGTFKLVGPTHIAGPVDGTVEMLKGAELHITHTGSFIGKIICKDIEIYGKVSGEIDSSGKVKIFPTALIEGKIKAKDLVIYPGAKVNIEGMTSTEN
ncbi:MAG: polymer-forming cytoskeletal protein [Bacteriovoracaceae bacterium]|nr:polymer-forming cytoskeletal protein [Bacteriovoracaceae bacterium]